MTMLLIAFLCFAILIAAWLMAPGKPVSMPSMMSRDASDAAPADIGMQH
jgi:hypothetical protein